MDEKMLKTSWKQRLGIAIIAAILLGSTVAVYVSIVLSKNSTPSTVNEEQMAELQAKYEEKYTEYSAKAAELNSQYYDEFSQYRSQVSAYNAETANGGGIVTKDLKIGDGDELTLDSYGYAAYYIGWCADEKVFDSSFDNFESPTTLTAPLIVAEGGMIEGWGMGLNGMKVGGVREITIPGEFAYGEDYDPCGNDGKNVPLKFVVMTLKVSDEFSQLANDLSSIYTELMYASYGVQ